MDSSDEELPYSSGTYTNHLKFSDQDELDSVNRSRRPVRLEMAFLGHLCSRHRGHFS